MPLTPCIPSVCKLVYLLIDTVAEEVTVVEAFAELQAWIVTSCAAWLFGLLGICSIWKLESVTSFMHIDLDLEPLVPCQSWFNAFFEEIIYRPQQYGLFYRCGRTGRYLEDLFSLHSWKEQLKKHFPSSLCGPNALCLHLMWDGGQNIQGDPSSQIVRLSWQWFWLFHFVSLCWACCGQGCGLSLIVINPTHLSDLMEHSVVRQFST